MEPFVTWEGVAEEILTETGCDDPPVDAYELAACCGVRVVELPTRGGALHVDTIYVDGHARSVRRHGLIAHELGHWALRRGGEDDVEEGARFLAGAFLLPRRAFDRDLARTAWDLRALRAKHVNASAELIARRVVTLRDAVACIWDEGKLRARVASPWLEVGPRPSKYERGLAARALELGDVVRDDGLAWAFPIFSPGYRRVITIVEAEQLSMRFDER